MSAYQVVVSFEAESDDAAIAVMEYLDDDLPAAGLEAVDFSASMPRRHVPAEWKPVEYPSDVES